MILSTLMPKSTTRNRLASFIDGHIADDIYCFCSLGVGILLNQKIEVSVDS